MLPCGMSRFLYSSGGQDDRMRNDRPSSTAALIARGIAFDILPKDPSEELKSGFANEARKYLGIEDKVSSFRAQFASSLRQGTGDNRPV